MTIRLTPNDGFSTLTSVLQRDTEAVLLDHRQKPDKAIAPSEKPTLNKQTHLGFLLRNLRQGFPARYIGQDASQPWLLYWTVHAFSLLQIGLDPENKQRIIDKVMRFQHPGGGFGGGQGQAPHLLPTYAAVCTLAMVGRPGPGGGWDQIDRKGLYNFFMSLKQQDGSFLVSQHMEVDVRGIYCLLVAATLLNILTPELVEGTGAFLASCQTFEGGFASASQPYFDPNGKLLRFPRPPLGEAHGGYTFCATAGWLLCQPFVSLIQEPDEIPSIDTSALLRWLVNMQGGASEIGGFRGRTNKLVDGCYSWWCGGAFNLLEALGVEALPIPDTYAPESTEERHGDSGEQWEDIPDSLYDREALQEYVLYAGQHPAGGLRDKPPKSVINSLIRFDMENRFSHYAVRSADSYHTLYCLAGLASSQHRVVPSSWRKEQVLNSWTTGQSPSETPWENMPDNLRNEVFAASLSWSEDVTGSKIVGGPANRVNATHPIFNLTITHTEAIMGYFYGQTIPPRK